MIRVVNKADTRPRSGTDIFVARPSIFGNPYPLSMGRENAINAYRAWFNVKLRDGDFKRSLDELIKIASAGDLNLVCFCFPKACHAGVIKEYLERIMKYEK